jgi:hypothetical protein
VENIRPKNQIDPLQIQLSNYRRRMDEISRHFLNPKAIFNHCMQLQKTRNVQKMGEIILIRTLSSLNDILVGKKI